MPRKPYIVIDKEYIGLKPFIETLPSHPHGERVLYDKRNFVQLFTVDGIRLVVKQYVRPHRINRFAYAYIRKSKAERTMSIGRQLLKLGINTPLPVAFIFGMRDGQKLGIQLLDIGALHGILSVTHKNSFVCKCYQSAWRRWPMVSG